MACQSPRCGLAVTGDDCDRTGDVAGLDVTGEHVSHPGQPFRREASGGHSLFLIVAVCTFGKRIRRRLRGRARVSREMTDGPAGVETTSRLLQMTATC